MILTVQVAELQDRYARPKTTHIFSAADKRSRLPPTGACHRRKFTGARAGSVRFVSGEFEDGRIVQAPATAEGTRPAVSGVSDAGGEAWRIGYAGRDSEEAVAGWDICRF